MLSLPFSSLLSAFDLLLVLCLFSFMGLFVDLIALFFVASFFFFVSVKLPFFMCFCMFNFAFTICQSFVRFLLVGWFLFFSFFPLLLCHVACGVLMLQAGVGPEPLRWET